MTPAERAMINQVQVFACLILVALVALGVKAGNDASLKCPAAANPGPVALVGASVPVGGVPLTSTRSTTGARRPLTTTTR